MLTETKTLLALLLLLNQHRSSLIIEQETIHVRWKGIIVHCNLIYCCFYLSCPADRTHWGLLALFSIPFQLINLISSWKLVPISTSEHFLLCSSDFLAVFDLDTVLFALMWSCIVEQVAFRAERSLYNANFRYAHDICSVQYLLFLFILNRKLDLQSGAKEKNLKSIKNRDSGVSGWACQMQWTLNMYHLKI